MSKLILLGQNQSEKRSYNLLSAETHSDFVWFS